MRRIPPREEAKTLGIILISVSLPLIMNLFMTSVQIPNYGWVLLLALCRGFYLLGKGL
jgi:hypothetical protein